MPGSARCRRRCHGIKAGGAQDVAPELAGAGVAQLQLADNVVQVANHQRVALLQCSDLA